MTAASCVAPTSAPSEHDRCTAEWKDEVCLRPLDTTVRRFLLQQTMTVELECMNPVRSDTSSVQIAMQSTQYKLSARNYKAQYAQMYFARLMELTPPVRKRAQDRWPNTPGKFRL